MPEDRERSPLRAGSFDLVFIEPVWTQPLNEALEEPQGKHGPRRLFLCLSGRGTLELNGKAYGIERGSVFLADPTTKVIWRDFIRQDTQLLCLPFYMQQIGENRENPRAALLMQFYESSADTVGCAPALCDYSDFLKRRMVSDLRLGFDSILLGFLLDAAAALSNESDSTSDADRIFTYVRSHARQKLSVADLARFLLMSDRALFYFFKKHFNTSPNEFINRVRMDAAAEYLANGLSVREVSEIFHFSEVTSFCRMYKKYFGMTPSEHRKIVEDGMSSTTRFLPQESDV